ncbi:MAG: hypothetical protein KKA84_15800 [Bacteroidetes bacterium]|nr:hypothetical protein [Bacteroidota bacterium]
MNFTNKINRIWQPGIITILLLLVAMSGSNISFGQDIPELATAQMKLGKIWVGVSASGGKATFEYRTGFFPNDFEIVGNRGQYQEAYTGAGINLSTTGWFNPYVDSVQKVSIYKYVNEYMPYGKVVTPMTNHLRFGYPDMEIEFQSVDLEDFGIVDPNYAEFQNHSFDQIVEVENETIFGVTVQRKIMSWTQNYNDNYIIADMTFSNPTSDTLHNFYINMQENAGNIYFSNGTNPTPQNSELFNSSITWQHYYGARAGDSLRVFYEYSADDPRSPGDNMGAPIVSQNGRLSNPNFTFYTTLHASAAPYYNKANDVDDFLQPIITHVGKPTQIPYTQGDDAFGSKNYYAIRGGFSEDYPMANAISGTYHGYNTDELGLSDYSEHTAGVYGGVSEKTQSYGPYTFAPGQKIHIVIASGFAGIGYEKGMEIGAKWLEGTLEDPPNMPDPNTGWLPSNFSFPSDATDMDKKKDRWISAGIDSVMLAASRAKWNFDHDYNIPKAPPPPDKVTITGYGDGVHIEWSAYDAEQTNNFAGYRIMRRVSRADTVYYEPIYNSGSDDLSLDHLYIDQSVLFGAQYYYYVQSKAKIDENDITAHPTTRGKMLYSSRTLQPDIIFINPPRTSSENLDEIRIAPNPYNINDPLLNTYGFTDQRGIIFFNLPGTVTIKIFTEHGDLIRSIDHDSPVQAGSVTWDMITSSQQVISSGVYIAVFEKPNGEVSYQKFIVVR